MALCDRLHRLVSRACATSTCPIFSKLLVLAIVAMSGGAIRTPAQLQQGFVFTAAGAVATRNDLTGTLTPVPASPFLPAAGGPPLAIDAKGRFLFSAGTNSIRMFQVNSGTGAYTETTSSPFASPHTIAPIFIATEPTGTFIAVVNQTGFSLGDSSIETFRIDAVNQALVPVPASFIDLVSTPSALPVIPPSAPSTSTLGRIWATTYLTHIAVSGNLKWTGQHHLSKCVTGVQVYCATSFHTHFPSMVRMASKGKICFLRHGSQSGL